MTPLRNDHDYSAEPLEYQQLRHRDNVDLNHAAADETLPSDHVDRFDPATDRWPTSLHAPLSSLGRAQDHVGSLRPTVPAPAGPRNQLQRAARPGTGHSTDLEAA